MRPLSLALAALSTFAMLAACTAPGETRSLEQIKAAEFGNRALAESTRIAAGAAQPVLEFTVEDTPPSIFVNYIVPDAQAAAFEAHIGLPPGFSLAKVQILESDPVPRYWLSLNVYRVSGLTTGLRAEWSTYVDDGSGSPRFMIVRARASAGSVDPLGPLALPEPFGHLVDIDDVIRTSMKRTEEHGLGPVLTADDLFVSSISLPDAADRQHVTPTVEWVAANDFIYWLNGVNDRTFHNGTAHSADLISIDLADVDLQDDTEWVPFLDPQPGHVLVYLDKIQFMIGPWWNVTEPDGRVDPSTRNQLLSLKKTMYGGLTNLSALDVLAGTGEPIVQSSIEASEPPTYWHWRIPAGQLAAFAAAADLPAHLPLAPVQLEAGGSDEHWLTLHVRRTGGAEAGMRAEWSTYVHDGGGVRAVILETRTDHASLNPVDLFLPGSTLEHAVAGGSLSTAFGNGSEAFTSTIALPAAGAGSTVVPSRAWVASSDLRYWRNGVADRVFVDSRALMAKTSVDPAATSVAGGTWAQFTAGGPDRVWLDDAGSDQIVNPWWKLGPR